MLDNLIMLMSSDVPRAAYIIVSAVIIAALVLWVSIEDFIRQKIKFWKMLIASAPIIILPLIGSFMCQCEKLTICITASIILWIVLLFLNIKFNKGKICGKADIDIASAVISLMVAYCIWLTMVEEPAIAQIHISAFLYHCVFLLLIGSVAILIGAVVKFAVYDRIKNRGGDQEKLINIRKKRVSAVIMFLPMSVFVPIMVMSA